MSSPAILALGPYSRSFLISRSFNRTTDAESDARIPSGFRYTCSPSSLSRTRPSKNLVMEARNPSSRRQLSSLHVACLDGRLVGDAKSRLTTVLRRNPRRGRGDPHEQYTFAYAQLMCPTAAPCPLGPGVTSCLALSSDTAVLAAPDRGRRAGRGEREPRLLPPPPRMLLLRVITWGVEELSYASSATLGILRSSHANRAGYVGSSHAV
ncbi:hypothetical protein F4780DRAFT_427352 [Xylariomycetidae sp. FL0641]|nr:hypothetical protein F4780DRAFT_427352 [Xylariomycetidae sp. FL0641]